MDELPGGPWRDTELVSALVENIDEALRALGIDVFLFNDEFDVPDFPDAANALADLIPECHRIRVAGGGFWEVPDRVNKLVVDALQTLPAGPEPV